MTNPHWLDETEMEQMGPQKGYKDLFDTDPIREHSNGWYIWNPEFSDAFGPFQDEFAARDFLVGVK